LSDEQRMNDDKITLFVTDDHQMVVDAIISLAGQDSRIQPVGHCNNGLEALEKVQAARPDVLILDISLPGMNGLEVCGQIKPNVPQTAIVMLSMNTNEHCIISAFEKGASGYLTKESVSLELCEAVHAVARGELYLAAGVPRTVLDKINQGSPCPQNTGTGSTARS